MFSHRLLKNVARIFNFPRLLALCHTTTSPCSTTPVVSSAVEIIKKSIGILQEKGRTVFLDDVETFAAKSVVPILLRYDFDERQILDLLTFWRDENLNGDFWFHLDARKLNAIFESFAINGVDAVNVAALLMNDKQVFELDPDQLQMKVLNLRHIFAPRMENSKRYSQIFGQFLVENSQILYSNDEENFRLSKNELRNFFSLEQMNKILSNSPEILLKKNFDDLELLYEYFYFVMGVDAKLLTKIRWFDKNFAFIRLRHQFSLKTGAFIRYNEKKPALSAKNIRLDRIIDSEDLNFAQYCNCSLDEYEFFQKIYGEKFADLDDFKAEIAKHCQHKRRFQEKYGRKIDQDDKKMENEDEESGEKEQTFKIPGFNNDRPVKINAQWSERWKK